MSIDKQTAQRLAYALHQIAIGDDDGVPDEAVAVIEEILSGGGATSTFYDLREFGSIGVGDGTKDITDVIDTALAEIPATDPSWGGAKGVLTIPAGRYQDAGDHDASGRVQIRGSGHYSTVLHQVPGVTKEMFRLGSYSGISDLTLNGRRTNAGSDLVAVNGSYCDLSRMRLTSAGGAAVSVGKGGTALLSRLSDLTIRLAMGHGINVVAGSGSTDGQWSRIDVGQCGLSGARISNGAQNLVDFHSWGNGLESTSDNHGLFLDSQSVVGVGIQTETNLGSGIHLGMAGSGGHCLTGVKSWGNAANGIRGFQSHRNYVQGIVYSNGVPNASGTTSNSYAGVFNDGGTDNNFDLHVWDEAKLVSPGSYASGITPTYPFPGRAAQLTQAYAYAEGTGADWNRIAGTYRRERTRSGTAVVNVGARNDYSGALLGALNPVTVASAATVTLPAWSDVVQVSGTTAITDITTARAGRRVTLVFTDAAPGGLTASSTLQIAGNFTPAQGGSITLVCAGTTWRETSRSS